MRRLTARPRVVGRRALLGAAAAVPVAAGLAGCGPGTNLLAPRPGLRVAVSFSAAELASFRRVLDSLDHLPGFGPKSYPVNLVPLGDDIPAALTARGAGRPDLVMLPRPGLVAENLDDLEPLPPGVWPRGDADDTYAPVWRSLLFHRRPGTGTRVPYGLPFKLADKSLVWYRPCLFDQLGVIPPASWSDWLVLNAELADRGVAPLALAGADGWTLTDFFENVLLAHSPDVYDRLGGPAPRPWDAPEVAYALGQLGRMWGAPGALSGGVRRSLVQQLPDAVLEVVRYHRAAMVVTTDFAEPIVRQFHQAPAGCSDDLGIFEFPGDHGDAPVVAGGDVAVLTAPARPEAKDLLRRLAHPQAPLTWIRNDGGFIAAHRRAPQDGYSDEIAPFARALHAGRFRFDLSDQLGAVGAGEGLWRVLQDFLAEVGDGRGGRAGRADAAAESAVRKLLAFERSRSGEGATAPGGGPHDR